MGVNLRENIELMLKDIPLGKLKCANHEISLANEPIAMPDYFYIRDNGKGRVDSYSVLPGVYISYVTLLAQDFYFYHNRLPKYNIFYCDQGNVFFEQNNACGVHVNADNLVFYQKHENEEPTLFLSQKYLKSVTLGVNPALFAKQLPEWLRRMQFESGALEALFLDDELFVAQSPSEVSMLCKQLFWVPEMYREAYLPIKTQELLWMLTQVQLDKKTKCDPCDNVELAKEMEKFLIDHIETYFSIEALSQRYQMAPATLQKAFKAVYGTTIGDYMQTYRLNRAKSLLLTTKKSIKDIAIMCGFESTSVFSASFKKQTGLSPTDYREQYGENYKMY